ncbi:hypothetical protein DPEC_G00356680 [Dallia pectoralis]|uniref:Uncharacterized protein n=1 Tax=Dallia pectoralis TaxID=75939 RepID=A0ACC2EZX2_DALPE|nr:hypothetical protein DPEC_G00356680 [Dallia pectoralis]
MLGCRKDKSCNQSCVLVNFFDKAQRRGDMESLLKWMQMLSFLLALLINRCYGRPQDLSGTKFIIPVETSNSFVRVTGDFSKPISAMTMCQRFFTDLQRDQSLFSLSTPTNAKDISVLLQSKGHRRKTKEFLDRTDHTAQHDVDSVKVRKQNITTFPLDGVGELQSGSTCKDFSDDEDQDG